MALSHSNKFSINVEKQGPLSVKKAVFPLRYGIFSEIRTPEYEFLFNLNGEIKFIRGLGASWPHPAEQLKRTDGNDWVYYSVGDDSSAKGVVSWLGEYYLPCLPYPSNSIWEIDYFSNPGIMNGFAAWPQLYANLHEARKEDFHPATRHLIEYILKKDDRLLYERAQELNSIIGGRVSVLPPDARHVDYEVIPINIADGCLFHCEFCCVKSSKNFQTRSRKDIFDQIQKLKNFYGRNIENYNAIFLGNHDALESGKEAILSTASEAMDGFGLHDTREEKPFIFLFGSVHSFIQSRNGLFEKLDHLPLRTSINIGFESVDKPTLSLIGKPVDESMVREAFKKMLDINNTYENVEVTGNFIIGEGLSRQHYDSLAELLRDSPSPAGNKGAIYLSPLKDSPKKRELLPLFYEIKNQSRLPVYVYLIQRL